MIVDAAGEEFAAVGYRAATLSSIGDRVGLTKAALYHYVDGKDELLGALFAEAARHIINRATAATPTDAPPLERLAAFVRAHVEVAVTTPTGSVLRENLDAILTTASTRAARQRHEQAVAEILTEAIARGDARPLSVGTTTKLVFGALNTVPRWYEADRGQSLEQVIDEAVEFVLRAVTRPSPERTTQ